jgi:hypothetical protein
MALQIRMNNWFLPSSHDQIDTHTDISRKQENVPNTFSDSRPFVQDCVLRSPRYCANSYQESASKPRN